MKTDGATATQFPPGGGQPRSGLFGCARFTEGRSVARTIAGKAATAAAAPIADNTISEQRWSGMTGEGLLLDPATLEPPAATGTQRRNATASTMPGSIPEAIQINLAAASAATVSLEGSTLVVSTTDADDDVDVGIDLTTGELTVSVNETRHRFAASDVTRLQIQTWGGDDVVMIASDLVMAATIDAGAGNDRIYGGAGNERIQAGEGNDLVDGGAGDDYIDGSFGDDLLVGGAGHDVLYGGEGNDMLDGGAGDDYLDGHLGNDVLRGGEGNDILSGGAGEDWLLGGAGDDRVYTGRGRDTVIDWSGSNAVISQAEDSLFVNEATRANWQTAVVEVLDVPETIQIDGTPAFQSRIRADLETLAASPTGQHMIGELMQLGLPLDQGGSDYSMTIAETNIEGGASLGPPGYVGPSRLLINPAYHLDDANGRIAPVVVLYHEMAHGRNVMTGNMASGNFEDRTDPANPDNPAAGRAVRNEERQVVGLPIDLDGNPDTPAVMSPLIPEALTENALRAELGYPRRASYLPPDLV